MFDCDVDEYENLGELLYFYFRGLYIDKLVLFFFQLETIQK